MDYARVAFIKFQPGTAGQAIARAKSELPALLREQAGFVSYSIVKMADDAGISISRWRTRAQAQEAGRLIDAWAEQTLGPMIVARDSHFGEVVFSTRDRQRAAVNQPAPLSSWPR